jgi:hypothetical protein
VRSDAELVEAARGGDREAFGTLIDRHRGRLTAAVRALVADPYDAEDVIQEALLQAFLGLDRLREPARFASWLCAIGTNLARMRLRRLRFRPALLERREVVVDGATAYEDREQMREALARLTPAERRVVVLHDLGGRPSTEIAAELGEAPGTVRVRLHRARARLRARLADHRRESPMIEVTLDDVLVRVLEEDADAELPRLADERLRVVLLAERGGGRVLPIWIGSPEGDALALQLGGEAMPRPLTADLTARLVEAAGARIERVAVSSLREKTFYAIVTVDAGGERREVDARPSDALNLALRVGAPIFVDSAVLEESALAADGLDARLDALEREWLSEGDNAPRAGQWRSLTPQLVKSFHPELGRHK